MQKPRLRPAVRTHANEVFATKFRAGLILARARPAELAAAAGAAHRRESIADLVDQIGTGRKGYGAAVQDTYDAIAGEEHWRIGSALGYVLEYRSPRSTGRASRGSSIWSAGITMMRRSNDLVMTRRLPPILRQSASPPGSSSSSSAITPSGPSPPVAPAAEQHPRSTTSQESEEELSRACQPLRTSWATARPEELEPPASPTPVRSRSPRIREGGGRPLLRGYPTSDHGEREAVSATTPGFISFRIETGLVPVRWPGALVCAFPRGWWRSPGRCSCRGSPRCSGPRSHRRCRCRRPPLVVEALGGAVEVVAGQVGRPDAGRAGDSR